jgi:hypothetical protein
MGGRREKGDGRESPRPSISMRGLRKGKRTGVD